MIDGSEREFDLPGRRGERSELDLGRFDAVREVCAWFAPGDGVALSSLRPRGAKGHDRDVIAATVFEPGGSAPVSDPRLSTTYAADGHPIKVGLELWIDRRTPTSSTPAASPARCSDQAPPGRGRGQPRGVPRGLPQPRRGRDRRVRDRQPMSAVEAVISDFGGVLTSPLLDSFVAFQDSSGISLESLGKAMAAIASATASTPCSSSRPGA